MSTSTLKVADTAAEFTSAKDGVQKASKSIKEARRETRGAARSDQRVTRLESTAARLTRELKDLGDRFNAATDPELKESLTGKIVAINAKIIAFNTDVNTQLEQLRNDVGQNTDDIAVEKGRNDGQDRQLEMLSEGQQSLNRRIDTTNKYVNRLTVGTFEKTPVLVVVVAIVVGIIAGFALYTSDFAQATVVPPSVVSAIFGLAIAAITNGILLSLTGGGKMLKVTQSSQPVVVTTPAPVIEPPVAQTVAPVRKSTRPAPADQAPTAVLVTAPGAPVGARS